MKFVRQTTVSRSVSAFTGIFRGVSTRRDSRARNVVPRGVPTPLVELSAVNEDTIENIQNWRVWAREQAHQATTTGFQHVDSPGLNNLFEEIDWLLQDNIDEANHVSRTLSVRSASQSQTGKVKVRLSLSELGFLWQRRLQERVPLQYLTHMAYWRDFSLVITPDVLIPRPETELLVDFALQAQQKWKCSDLALAEGPWLDMGTGSGAIAIGIVKAFIAKGLNPNPVVHAVDLCPKACVLAQHNSVRNGVQNNIKVTQGSWFNALGSAEIKFSGIVSNPPYIPSEEMYCLQPEVLEHEPLLALDGGSGSGTESLVDVCFGASIQLQHGGFLALETLGDEQSKFVRDVLLSMGSFRKIEILQDYTGIKRFVTALRL